METKEYKTKRLILSKDEKEIAKSWGSLWSRFGVLERSGRPIILIFGDWSGYRSSQYRITHIDQSHTKLDNFHGTVQFTDNTTMSVWTKSVTREDIIRNKWYCKRSYTDLIGKLVNSGQSFYRV